MTAVYLLLGLLLLGLAWRAGRADQYHAPAASMGLALSRSGVILLLVLVMAAWPSADMNDEPAGARAILVAQGASAGGGNFRGIIERKAEQIRQAGYEPLLILLGTDPVQATPPDIEVERYDDLRDALLRVLWEMERDERAVLAVVGSDFPEILRSAPWTDMRISWVRLPASDSSRVLELLAPAVVFPGQPFSGEFLVSPDPGAERLRLYMDGSAAEAVFQGATGGRSSRSFTLRIEEPGFHTLRLATLRDDGTTADSAAASVFTRRRPAVLYISALGGNTPLAETLAGSGFAVRPSAPVQLLEPVPLSPGGGDIIVLDAVPTNYLSKGAVERLRTAVADSGSILLFVSGSEIQRSDGGSGIEALLPVVIGGGPDDEEKDVALVAVVDTSLSMFYKIGGGGGWGHSVEGESGWGIKIKMAKKALINLSKALPPRNPFGVLTVTDTPSWVVDPTAPRDPDREEELIGRIKAYGPGINLYSALLEARKKLLQLQADTKHILVFLDTADVDEYQVNDVGTVWDLLDDLIQEGITVSLIGFGRRGDEHIPQLNRFADESGGYFYLTTDVTEIPGFTLKDLDLVSENLVTYRKRKVTHFQRDLPGIQELPDVRGQAMTTMKPGASLLAWTDRGYPLLAAWRLGAGTVAAFTADNGRSLATEWVGPSSPWESLLARLVEMTEGGAEAFIARGGTTPVLMVSNPPGRGIKPPAVSLLDSPEFTGVLPVTEVAPGDFAAPLPAGDGRPATLDIAWAGSDAPGARMILSVGEGSEDNEQMDTDVADLALSPVPSRTQEGSLDPSVWRLILLLAVFLVSLDELFRAPDPHP